MRTYLVYWVSTDQDGKRHGETSTLDASSFEEAYRKAYGLYPEVTQVVQDNTRSFYGQY